MILQVAAVLTLVHGSATTPVRNNAPEAMRVLVDLRHGTVERGAVVLGPEVRAIVSPPTFTLASGETQLLRIRVQEAVPAGTVLRLRTCLTPLAAEQPIAGSETTKVARLVVRVCLIGKVLVQ
jgi:P pilus assembly chaperone PapD